MLDDLKERARQIAQEHDEALIEILWEESREGTDIYPWKAASEGERQQFKNVYAIILKAVQHAISRT